MAPGYPEAGSGGLPDPGGRPTPGGRIIRQAACSYLVSAGPPPFKTDFLLTYD